MGDAGDDAVRLDGSAFLEPYRSVVERSDPAALPAAMRLWARLGPDRWPLEWRLPVWLGDAFGLDRAISAAISLANVLGLASVRLRDDLADGDVEPADRPTAERLSEAFYRAALDVHRRWFGPSDPFWGRLDAWMTEWEVATLGSAGVRLGPSAEVRPPLAERGAPLKVSALAVCLLTDRERDLARIGECLDHALTAIVLYDDACDWEADLAAGRANAFAAAASRSRRGRAAGGGQDRADVLASMIAGASVRPYFSRIRRELERAAEIAGGLAVEPLAAFCGDLAERFDAEARELERRYDAVGETAMGLVFGPGWMDRSRGTSVAGTA